MDFEVGQVVAHVTHSGWITKSVVKKIYKNGNVITEGGGRFDRAGRATGDQWTAPHIEPWTSELEERARMQRLRRKVRQGIDSSLGALTCDQLERIHTILREDA